VRTRRAYKASAFSTTMMRLEIGCAEILRFYFCIFIEIPDSRH